MLKMNEKKRTNILRQFDGDFWGRNGWVNELNNGLRRFMCTSGELAEFRGG